MGEIFKFLFNQFVDPLSFPLNPLYEWVIITVLHEVVFRFAYRIVGDLYHSGIIRGRMIGSFLHWLFRGISFVAAWFTINLVIWLYYFVVDHWLMLLAAVGSIVILLIAATRWTPYLVNRDSFENRL